MLQLSTICARFENVCLHVAKVLCACVTLLCVHALPLLSIHELHVLACPLASQHWDGTGGNGSALRHYQATGCQYPLVVKLGTITPNGADVYSYADEEDDMVWMRATMCCHYVCKVTCFFSVLCQTFSHTPHKTM